MIPVVSRYLRHPEFRVGMRETAQLMPGLAAWGLMTGIAMIKSGLSLPEAVLMGVIVFAGSAQLAALPLIAGGAPIWVILATSFCVNLRFAVFSAHIRPYVMHQRMWRRLLTGYFVADLSYVLFTARFPQFAKDDAGLLAQEAYWLGNGTLNWIVWTASSLLGVVLANAIPVSWGLAFAGILSLLAMLCALANTRLRAVSVLVACVTAVVAYSLPFKLNILVGIAGAVVVCLMLEKPERPPSSGTKKSGETT